MQSKSVSDLIMSIIAIMMKFHKWLQVADVTKNIHALVANALSDDPNTGFRKCTFRTGNFEILRIRRAQINCT
jgi:hypothetical protein